MWLGSNGPLHLRLASAPHIGVNRIPEHVGRRRRPPRRNLRVAPRLRVMRRSPDIAVHKVDEMRIAVHWWMVLYPSSQPRSDQFVSLRRARRSKRHAEFFLGFGVEPIES